MRSVGVKRPITAFHTDTCGAGCWGRPWPLSRRRSVAVSEPLSLEVDEVLQQLVGCGNDSGVGLEAALGHDHVGELLTEVDVRHFQRPGGQLTTTAGSGNADE